MINTWKRPEVYIPLAFVPPAILIFWHELLMTGVGIGLVVALGVLAYRGKSNVDVLLMALVVVLALGISIGVLPAGMGLLAAGVALSTLLLRITNSSRMLISSAIVCAAAMAAYLQIQSGEDAQYGLWSFGARAVILTCAIGFIGLVLKPEQRLVNFARVTLISLALVTGVLVASNFAIRNFTRREAHNYSAGGGEVRASAWLPSPNELGLVSAILLISMVVLILEDERRFRGLYYFAALTSIYTLIQSGTRSAILAVIIGSAAIVLVNLRRKKANPKTLALAGIGLAVALVIVQKGVTIAGRDLFGSGRDGSAVYRQSVQDTLWNRLESGAATAFGSGFENGNQLKISPLTAGINNVDSSLFYLIAGYGLIFTIFIFALASGAVIAAFWRKSMAFSLALVFLTVCGVENSVSWITSLILLSVACIAITPTEKKADESSISKQRAVFGRDGVHEPSAIGTRSA